METAFPFPEELRPFVKGYGKAKNYTKKENIRKNLEKNLTDNKIRSSFKNWLSQHPQLQTKSQAISKIYLQATEIEEKESLKNRIPNVFLRLSVRAFTSPLEVPFVLSRIFINAIQTSALLLKIEQGKTDELTYSQIADDLDLLIEYLDLGIITLEDVANLLTNDAARVEIFYSPLAEKTLPKLLDRFSGDDLHLLTKILCAQEKKYGRTGLDSRILWKYLVPILKKYIPSHFDQLEQILTVKDRKGRLSIIYSTYPELWNLLNAYIPDHMDELTSLLIKRGQQQLLTKEYISLLENYIPNHMEKLAKILSVQDDEGDTIFLYEEDYETLFPLLLKFIPEHEDLLVSILSIKNKEGLGVLDYQKFFEHSLKWLDSLIPNNVNLLVKILSTISLDKRVIYSVDLLKPLLVRLYYSHPQEFMNLICLQNLLGKTLCHYVNRTNISLLKRVSNVQFSQIMSIADHHGDTPLHTYSTFETHKDRIELAKLTELFDFENKEGLSVRKCQTYALSSSWLNRQKYTDEAYLPYSLKEYQKVTSQVEKSIEMLWNGLSFNLDGSNKKGLSPAILIVEGKKHSPEEIKKTLSEMLGLMKKKQAWLGTPKKDPCWISFTMSCFKTCKNSFQRLRIIKTLLRLQVPH